MFISYILLIIGFVLLAKGADLFVDGSVSVAKYFRVSPLFIGLTLAAFGTSAPEAAVSVKATIVGVSGIALGNVIGSNIANICLAIGIATLIKPLYFENSTIKKEIPFLLFISVLLLLFTFNFSEISSDSTIARWEGIILLIFLIGFLLYLSKMAVDDRKLYKQKNKKKIPIGKSTILTLVGTGAIVLGGHLTVENAIKIAQMWGVDDKIIGISVVALGTSIPEIITSIVAVKKGQISIAIGNIVGSNIFNILFVLGIAASINPITLPSDVKYDVGICLFITLIFFTYSIMKKHILRIQGIILLLLYVGYILFLYLT